MSDQPSDTLTSDSSSSGGDAPTTSDDSASSGDTSTSSDGSSSGGDTPTTTSDSSSNGDSGGTPTPAPTAAEQVSEALDGLHKIVDIAEAGAYLAGDAGEAALGAIEPVSAILLVVELFTNVIQAMETEERGCSMRGWCYAVLYGALNMGTPPEPTFQGSLGGPDQDQLDKQGWDQGVADGQQELANGADGVALNNKVLLLVAHDGAPAAALNDLWQSCCAKTGDSQLAQAYPNLSWPQPTGA
jgi:hypothetical protein